jgi:hypothetical protein
MANYEQGEIGHDLFRAACRMGLEGIVSKRRDRSSVSTRNESTVATLTRIFGVHNLAMAEDVVQDAF